MYTRRREIIEQKIQQLEDNAIDRNISHLSLQQQVSLCCCPIAFFLIICAIKHPAWQVVRSLINLGGDVYLDTREIARVFWRSWTSRCVSVHKRSMPNRPDSTANDIYLDANITIFNRTKTGVKSGTVLEENIGGKTNSWPVFSLRP